MKILRYPLGQMQANCYFLIQENNCLIIDPADDASFILEEIQRRRLNLVGMLATHGHFDHVMAVGEIQLSYVETRHAASLPLFIHEKDMFLIARLSETAEYFLGYKTNIIQPKNIKHHNSSELKIACPEHSRRENFKLKIINVPGHTPGSCCYYFKKENVLFTGDTLFKQGIGRYDFSYSNKKDLDSSLKKIFKLPGNTIVYSGHGEETIINNEK
ncbi:MAG: MBL fold metallo-hydrolase [bacterium]|nr:MBL fold metallo-hydrolase [bacterium]